MSTFIAKHEIHDMINFDNDKDLIADKKQENAMFMLVPACRGACARFYAPQSGRETHVLCLPNFSWHPLR